jgi:hypothetical protein
MIERLHGARFGYEIGKNLARHAASKIDRLEQRRLDRIVGVDYDAPDPILGSSAMPPSSAEFLAARSSARIHR